MINFKNNLKHGIKAVIFDMDGVITNTMPDHFTAWRSVLADAGVHVSHLDIYSREGQRGITSVQEIFAQRNKSLSAPQARQLLARKEELFKKIARLRFIPGARRFIKELHRRGLKLALVTGTSRHEVHRILPEHIYRLFDVVVTANDVRNGKPHPDPYLLALRQLQIPARDAVVIENAPFGIKSAKAAGLCCLALETSLPRPHLKKADKIFSSFADLSAHVHWEGRIAVSHDKQ